MKKPVVVALAAGILVVSIVAVQLWSELRTVRGQTAQLRNRIAELQPAPAPAPVPPAATTIAPTVQAQTAVAPSAAVPAAEKSDIKPVLEAVRKTLASAEGREMALSMGRVIMPRMYPDVGRELGLSDAEVEKFFDLLARQQADLTANVYDPAATQDVQRKIQESRQASQAELTALLGNKYPQWQEYQKTLPMRRQVTQLQTMLNSGNNALGYEESKPLIAALSAEQDRIQQDRRNAPRPPGVPQVGAEEELRRMEEDSRRLVSAASAQLNPQQLDSYRQLLKQQQDTLRTLMPMLESAGK